MEEKESELKKKISEEIDMKSTENDLRENLQNLEKKMKQWKHKLLN